MCLSNIPVYLCNSVYNHCDRFALFGLTSSLKTARRFVNVPDPDPALKRDDTSSCVWLMRTRLYSAHILHENMQLSCTVYNDVHLPSNVHEEVSSTETSFPSSRLFPDGCLLFICLIGGSRATNCEYHHQSFAANGNETRENQLLFHNKTP